MISSSQPIWIALFSFALSSCVGDALRQTKLDPKTLNQPLHNSFVSEFRKMCLYSNGNILRMRDKTDQQEWLPARDEILKLGGLSALRKKILKVPGGGGIYSHTQTLHYKITSEGTYYLNLEERFHKKRLNSNHCVFYSQADHLTTCEAVGKMMGRAPDRNQIYEKNDAHFISWGFKLSGQSATISCERTPNSKALPYDGVILSLVVGL